MNQLMASEPAVEIFRHNVTSLMDEREISISKMAMELGISRPGLSRLLAGDEGLTFDRAEKIADYLGIPLASLITEKFRQPA